jgi:hypothetical protein
VLTEPVCDVQGKDWNAQLKVGNPHFYGRSLACHAAPPPVHSLPNALPDLGCLHRALLALHRLPFSHIHPVAPLWLCACSQSQQQEQQQEQHRVGG